MFHRSAADPCSLARAQFQLLSNKWRDEVMKDNVGSELKFAALHGCETKWKTCGQPGAAKAHDIDSFGIPTDGS